ncbi:MAG TPA: error-prone DNA polymerase [Gammaproteobacteria bacterium]|nr:error-prone DNA polymerase [Gammaproteobacteria bacterium]
MDAAHTPPYAELHCLSHFTFLRGASSPAELVARARELDYSALAITDECSLAGVVRAHLAARDAGLPLIIGSEFRLTDGLRLVLLARDRSSYGELSALISLARRRTAKGRYELGREDVARLAPGCLLLWIDAERRPPLLQDRDAAWLRRHFPHRSWIGLSARLDGHDRHRLQSLQRLGTETGMPLVACGDVHMHRRNRRILQDTLTAIRLGSPLADAGLALYANGERHLRSRCRLARLYPPELLEETVHIAERCHFSLDSLRYEYPQELVPPGRSPAAQLRRLAEAGLRRRWPQGAPARVTRQLQHELQLIAELEYEAYFLTVHDIVRFARSRGILCQGRGSAANSVVCYCLGITEVDPARIDTLFERFISRQRNEPPDIDVDFEHHRREEVIQYIYEKYGRERAALAATVIRYRPRSAVRDVGKALGLADERIERLRRNIHWLDGQHIEEERLREAGLDPTLDSSRRLRQLVTRLTGFPRHLSQHVGGFVIARDSLERMVPVENAAMPQRTVIQWDKDDLDALGLLKIDCLALGMLSAIHRCFDLVRRHHGRSLGMDSIPGGDTAVYDMISRADTVGVFQIESRAQMSMLPRLRPACFYDLVIEVAIVRPGPIQGDMVHPYLRRRQGLEAVDYPSAEVRAVLQRTLGIPIFQEQVIKLAMVAAGFSAGEADRLRRSMASWRRHGLIMEFEQRLIEGMRARGYTEDFARQLFRQITGFGEYGFPESHAASFALLVYVSAWLKHHYPHAFTCALLNSQPMGFYSPRQLVDDLRRHGGEVRPADVCHSEWACTLERGDSEAREDRATTGVALRLGLQRVKKLPRQAAERIIAARAQRPFRDIADLATRAGLGRGELETLAAANTLASLGGHRYRARWDCAGVEAPLPLLGDGAIAETPPPLRTPAEGEELVADYASTGLSLGRHPLALLRPRLRALGLRSARQVQACPHGSRVHTAGLVTGRQSPSSASGTLFVTLEDETGITQLIVWPALAQRQRHILLHARLLAVEGEVQREGEVLHLVARRLQDHSRLLGRLLVPSRDFH